MSEEYINFDKEPEDDGKKRKMLYIVGGVLGVILIGLVIFAITAINDKSEAERIAEEKQTEIEQLQLENEQIKLQNEYDALNSEFSDIENRQIAIKDDSVTRALNEKYNAAKLKVEKLIQELNSEKAKSAKQIKDLKSEIETLKGILRHYVEEIDRLNKENAELRTENAEIKSENEQLNNRVQETSRRNEVLSERMTLAEKLNVTGVSLTALNSKGKNEKKIAKAKQLMVTFTIPQNNSTPVGEKTIYMRLISPSGNLLGNGGTFKFEGGSVPYSARKIVEYAGEEISGITIYWDVNTAIEAGEYTVELFADNYRLASRRFTMK